MQAIRNALARLAGGVVSQAEHEATQQRIRALIELSANQQAEIIDKAQQIKANRVVIEAYQEDLQQTSAEVVRLRAALALVKTERAEWRDRAMGYREKMGMQKRRVRG
ncbi:MAG: hypothetical protein NDI93_01465 [Pseudomonas sp.]|nr:hypothetical protein [Pseudomonas sp.]